MGRVLTEVKIENTGDLWDAQCGRLPADQVRTVTVADALVDTGATMLSLPTRIIALLGLRKQSSRRITSSIGPADAAVFDAVRLTIQDRFCTMDVLEVPDAVPVLIGQLPLEALDFVVDMPGRRLIGNPAHGGVHTCELY
ncbi:MAG TPA: aspartyl protease family protein [Pirellulales bacterium]|nr:aspartyl protease family protein [Pirellulales bacterium]